MKNSMKTSKNKSDLILKKFAIEAALKAGTVLLKYFRKQFEVMEKPGAGLVTLADITAERVAVAHLLKASSEMGFVTEEKTIAESAQKPGRWILDPLDGTTNFVHGFPMFCVSIGAEWEGKMRVGVIYHPILKELYVAVRGKGATVNGKPMRTSTQSKLANTLLTTGFAYQKDRLTREIKAFSKLSTHVRGVRRPGSAALDLAYTARGVFDGYWERNLNPWDIAAGALLVQEAGGKVTDFEGHPFNVLHRDIVAANPKLHQELLRQI